MPEGIYRFFRKNCSASIDVSLDKPVHAYQVCGYCHHLDRVPLDESLVDNADLERRNAWR